MLGCNGNAPLPNYTPMIHTDNNYNQPDITWQRCIADTSTWVSYLGGSLSSIAYRKFAIYRPSCIRELITH